MEIDYDIAMEIASHEAIVRQAYKDSVGVWTWSVGLTSATGHLVERYIGKPQSLEHCLRVYVWALDNYADTVRKVFAGVKLTKAQFAAALSFHWNTGAISRATWVKHFKAGNMAAAEKAFLSWSKPTEIKARRQKEADLLFRGKWSNKGTITEYTRVKANGTPDWGSAKRTNIEKELRAAIAGEVPAADKVIVEQPVVPAAVDKAVTKQTSGWGWGSFGVGALGSAGTAALGAPWQTIALFAGLAAVGGLIALVLGPWIVRRIKTIRSAVEAE